MNSLFVVCLIMFNIPNNEAFQHFSCSRSLSQAELVSFPMADWGALGRQIVFELHPHMAALSKTPKSTGSLDIANDPNAEPEKGRVIVCYDNIRLAPHATGPMPASSCPGTAAWSEDRAAAWIAAEKAKQPPEHTNFVVYDLVRVKN